MTVDVLLVTYTNSLGHAGRSHRLACRLRSLGLRVMVAGGGCFDTIFDNLVLPSPQIAYVDLRPWLEYYLPGLPFFGSDERRRYRENWTGNMANSEPTPSLETLTCYWENFLRQHRPRHIIADGRPEIHWAALSMDIPCIGLGSFVWTDDFRRAFPGGRWTTCNDADLLARFNAEGVRRRLPLIETPWEPLLGSTGLLADAEELTGPTSSRFVPLGPLLYEAPQEGPLPAVDINRPVILVTSGTSSFSVLDHVVTELTDREVQVIAIGGLRHGRDLGLQAEGNLYRYLGMAPFEALLRLADLVVCHGGSQSLYPCAIRGCQALVIPHHFDHEANGRLFERNGHAVCLSPDLPPPTIADRAMRMLSQPTRPGLAVAQQPDSDHKLMELLGAS